jgi:uncharacterized protein (TIGR02246 family)
MSDEDDKQKIREVISTWMRASADGDTERLLSLMAEGVVFLVPGRPPMRGRAAFAATSSSFAGKMLFDGKSEIQEIRIAGDFAYCWSHLTLTVTPVASGSPSSARDIFYRFFGERQTVAGCCSVTRTCS